MKRTHLALVTATTVLAGVAALAVPGSGAAPDTRDRVELQGGLNDIVSAGAVGALVEVRDKRGVWRGSSGVSELGKEHAVPVGGRFRVGSITKTFVATVVLQLVAEGRLSLDDPVQKWLPGVVPDAGQRITLRHLLSHTSGLYDYLHTLTLPPASKFLKNRSRTWRASELIQRALANPPTFQPPGSAFQYSNTNYALLGEIIRKATGQSYGETIKRRILRPLRLRNTTVPGTSQGIPGRHAHGYVPIEVGDRMQLVDYTKMNPSVMGASGEMISTAKDLNRFFAALLRGRLLPANLLKQMKASGIKGGRYGLGLFQLDTSCGVRVYGHDGDALAYQSWSYSTTDGRRQVTIALTPNFREDLDDIVSAYLDKALCS